MHRNTYLLLIFLAIFAAVVVGVNLTRGPEPTTHNPPPTTTTPPTPQATKPTVYELAGCGIAFPTPDNHTALEGPGNTVVFTGKTGGDTIIVTCQKNIPRPKLSANKIEQLGFELPNKPNATFSANLYHDTQTDKLIFKHPTNGLDIFISGTGEAFQTLIRSLSILQ